MRLSTMTKWLTGKSLPDFGDAARYYRFFLPYAKRYWVSYLVISSALLLSVATTLGYAWFLKGIVEAATAHNVSRITWMVGCGVVFYGVSIGVSFLNSFVRTVTMNKLRNDLKASLFERLIALPQSFFNRHQSGDLLSRLNNDAEVAIGAIGTNLINTVRLPIMAAAAFIYLFGMNAKLSLVLLCFGPIALISASIFSRYIRINGRKIQDQLGKITGLTTEILAGHAVMRAFTLERFFHRKYTSEMEELLTLQDSSARLGGGFRIGAQVAGAAALLMCIGMGAYDVSNGIMTAGTLLAFISLIDHLISPFTGMAQQFGGLQRSLAAAERLWEVFEEPSEVVVGLNNIMVHLNRPCGLELQNVSFSYDGTKMALNDVSMSIPAGSMYALVGPSGAGKSTLFQLIMRFYTPETGDIRLGGHSYSTMDQMSIRHNISYVQQEPFLFSGSIKENILHGRPDASDSDVIRAARQANIHEFIVVQPHGYDTQIGEHGVRLSGGQKQRIGIARAILKDAPVLLLDEATSALDSESESLVQGALMTLTKSRTTFVIAHRLSTIQHADSIIVMNEGSIVEIGNHRELITQEGLYARLHRLQSCTSSRTMESYQVN